MSALAAVDALIRAQLGTRVTRVRFVSERRSVTWGVELADGSSAVVKAHPPGLLDDARLSAVQAVQSHLHRRGFPCPRPLFGPCPLGGGVAVAEELLDVGRAPDPASAGDRAAMARTLAEIALACEPLRPLPVLDVGGVPPLPPQTLWPAPLDARLDLTGGGERGAWIDAIGVRARRRRKQRVEAPAVLCHCDWHVEHLRLERGSPVAVYDWDSLIEGPEPFVVGCAVGGFTADWRTDEPPVVPSRDVALAFVAEYERPRGRRFDATERETIDAHWLEMTAYAARVELAREDAGLPSSTRYREELANHGDLLGSI